MCQVSSAQCTCIRVAGTAIGKHLPVLDSKQVVTWEFVYVNCRTGPALQDCRGLLSWVQPLKVSYGTCGERVSCMQPDVAALHGL